MATTYYVDASRPNDTGNGLTLATAKKTINAGINLMSGGDTLLVKAGTYTEQLYNPAIPSGTGYPVGATTIKAYTGDSPTLNGLVYLEGKSNIIWDGININGAGNAQADTSTNFIINSGSYIRITNCEVYNAVIHNFLVQDYAAGAFSNIFLDHLKVHDPGQLTGTSSFPIHNFYINADNVTSGPITIDNCEIYNSTKNPNSWGITTYGYAVCNGAIVSNCYIHDNNQGLQLGCGNNHQAYNNVVYNNALAASYGEAAITVGYGTGLNNIQVYNNTITGNYAGGAYGISVGTYGTPTNTLIKNNIVWANAVDSIQLAGGSGTVTSNNLMGTNPVFVSGQFTLQSTSPARGYGVNLTSVFTTDKAGNTRPSSGAWDAGAYMYVSGKTDPTLSVTNSPQTYNGSSHAATVTGSVAGHGRRMR